MSDVVPEFIDPPAPPALRTPRPFRWDSWLAAVAFLPFAPKRIGVRLSVTNWAGAIASFLVCAVLAVMIAGYAGSLLYKPQPWLGIVNVSTNSGHSPSSTELEFDAGILSRVQNAVTGALNMIFVVTESLGDIYAVSGIIFAICAQCLFMGFLALPYMAAGERLGRLLSRSIKLSLFSSMMLVVAAMGAAALTHIGLRFTYQFEYLEWTPTFITISVIAAAWWFNVIVRMGRLYAGPADGPA